MVTPGNPAKLGTPRTELTVAHLSKVPILTPPSFLFPPSSIALAFNVYFEFKQPLQKIIAQFFYLTQLIALLKATSAQTTALVAAAEAARSSLEISRLAQKAQDISVKRAMWALQTIKVAAKAEEVAVNAIQTMYM